MAPIASARRSLNDRSWRVLVWQGESAYLASATVSERRFELRRPR